MKNDNWVYEETTVGQIRNMLNEYEIEVDSPDGWVCVTDFVDKGMHEEHILETEDGNVVRCSDHHLFETEKGWKFAKDLIGKKDIKVLCSDNSYKKAKCVKNTGNFIPIVDITVDHENHRYYTNNISSHNTGGGKSLIKCHMAANHLMYGKNVLYITMEMAEERIAERIDANIMDTTIDQVKEIPRDVYEKRINRYKGKTTGKLVIKEYPTGSAHAGHFRHLLNELKMKKGFTPDIVFVDYLNICSSSRVRGAAAANSYTLVKSIAEEIRGLAMEFNCAVVTSSQFNRDGYGNSDVDLTNTSESMGITHTADCILGLVTSEALDELGQLMIKQLKNRWGDLAHYRRFLVGIDRAKMKIYNLEESAQSNVHDAVGGGQQQKDDGPAFDKGAFGSRMGGKKPALFKSDGLL